ncbi:MAG: ABC transporter permease, partial [Terriglobales bacterium]
MAEDLRYAFRMLRRAPGFTAVALLTLALGIGANTAIFSLVSPMLFQPLPFPQPQQLVQIAHVHHGHISNGLEASEAIYLVQHQRAFSATAIVDLAGNANLSGDGPALKVSARPVSHGFFDVYAVAPSLGRGFTAADDVPGAPPVAVLGDALWRSHFAADPQILGRPIHLDGTIYTVVGVMPPGFNELIQGFTGFAASDIWTAMQPTEAALAPLGPNLNLDARLKPGVTIAQAQSDLVLQKAAFNQINPNVAKQMSWGVQSYHDAVVGDTSPPLLLLLGAVGLVLLIACANLANLLLSRSTARTREMAIRSALGAEPARILRQLLTESLLLSCLGAALGLLVAAWAVPLLAQLTPADLALPITGQLSAPALLYTLALAIITGLLFGLAPAWQASRPALQSSLKDSAAGASSPQAGRARSGL